MNPIERLGNYFERNTVLGIPFGKLRSSVRGQTALEYLLIIVVAIIVVVAIFLWVQSTASTTQTEANQRLGEALNQIRT